MFGVSYVSTRFARAIVGLSSTIYVVRSRLNRSKLNTVAKKRTPREGESFERMRVLEVSERAGRFTVCLAEEIEATWKVSTVVQDVVRSSIKNTHQQACFTLQ